MSSRTAPHVRLAAQFVTRAPLKLTCLCVVTAKQNFALCVRLSSSQRFNAKSTSSTPTATIRTLTDLLRLINSLERLVNTKQAPESHMEHSSCRDKLSQKYFGLAQRLVINDAWKKKGCHGKNCEWNHWSFLVSKSKDNKTDGTYLMDSNCSVHTDFNSIVHLLAVMCNR